MSRKITEQFVKTVPGPGSGSMYVWDAAANGFGLRITSTGKKSFVLAYRIGGRQRRYTIGPYPDFSLEAAKTKAGELRVGIKNGIDPLEEKRKESEEPTFGELLTAYMESEKQRRKRPSSQRNDRAMAEKIVRPKFGKLRLKDLQQRDIESLHRKMKATPYRANRMLSFVSAVYTWGIKEKWLTAVNPVRGIEKYPEDKREAWLKLDQMEKLNEALDQYPDQSPANALRLLLLTGARLGEVIKATWDQFDLHPERRSWTKPSSHTKQKKVHHVELSSEALDLLISMAPVNLTGPLFPGRNGPRTTLRRVWKEVCTKAGLTQPEMEMVEGKMTVKHRPVVRIHDLRHSYASYLASANVSLHKIGQLLGHSQPSTTQRYAHLQPQGLREATDIMGTTYRKTKKRA